MPTLALVDNNVNLHWYYASCDLCDWREITGPYTAGTDEDRSHFKTALNAIEDHGEDYPGHRTYLHRRLYVESTHLIETYISEADFEKERVRA